MRYNEFGPQSRGLSSRGGPRSNRLTTASRFSRRSSLSRGETEMLSSVNRGVATSSDRGLPRKRGRQKRLVRVEHDEEAEAGDEGGWDEGDEPEPEAEAEMETEADAEDEVEAEEETMEETEELDEETVGNEREEEENEAQPEGHIESLSDMKGSKCANRKRFPLDPLPTREDGESGPEEDEDHHLEGSTEADVDEDEDEEDEEDEDEDEEVEEEEEEDEGDDEEEQRGPESEEDEEDEEEEEDDEYLTPAEKAAHNCRLSPRDLINEEFILLPFLQSSSKSLRDAYLCFRNLAVCCVIAFIVTFNLEFCF
ncbi:unnamed protein product [Protopolystoma xenopodis]|uniref:Uncharacterized protein n=1 Tax=Protopolystoma xenopodis TaxID=117903 RepID=A0A3S5AE81_9PLAT|nr:unnamed protein product [Protopolystoma xenopodis]